MEAPTKLVSTAVNYLWKRWYAKTPRLAQTVADVSLIAGLLVTAAAPYISIPAWVVVSASMTVYVVANLQTENKPLTNKNKEELK